MGQNEPRDGPVLAAFRPPTSVATELIRVVLRLVFFGALVVLALAVLGGVLGVAMVGQSLLDLAWLRGRRQARSA